MNQRQIFRLGVFTLILACFLWLAVAGLNEAKEVASHLDEKSSQQSEKIDSITRQIRGFE